MTLIRIIFKGPLDQTFKGLDTAGLNAHFAAVHILQKGVTKLIFSDGLDDPIPDHVEALLRQ
jgi:hypothetical protein